jgi:predicted DNA-binding WGR domain protein
VIVETRWGRIGAAGQHKVRSFAHGAEADRYVRSILARRNSARTRLGTAYRVQSE